MALVRPRSRILPLVARSTPSYYSRSLAVSRTMSWQPPSAEDAAAGLLANFSNTVITRRQLIDANQVQKLSLTLNRTHLAGVDITRAPPPQGTPLPPGYHLVYFTPDGLESELGADGTDRTFNAPAPFTRRMWAGGEMRWPAAGDTTPSSALLRVGDEAEERTRLVSATAKKSRAAPGGMVLVEVDKEIWTPSGLAIVDRRSWIFRPALDAGQQSTRRLELPQGALHGPSIVKDVHEEGTTARQFRWSPVGLFRFSALTFNAHKIHYNEDWTRDVEAHPAAVVHGPLNLINMLDYWRDVHGKGADPRRIVYRATSPLYAGEMYDVRTKGVSDGDEGPSWEISVEREGVVCMKGDIS